MIHDPFGIFLALAAAVFLAVRLEGCFRFFRTVSAGLLLPGLRDGALELGAAPR